MKKTNFTFLIQHFKSTLLLLLLVGFSTSTDVLGQCTLVCGGTINVGLDGSQDNCSATLLAADLLKGEEETCPNPQGGSFEVHILDHHGNFINDKGLITFDLVGQTVQYKVIEVGAPGSQPNACWGYAVIEDKQAPTLICEDPDESFYCYDLVEFVPQLEYDCDAANIEIRQVGEVVRNNNCLDYGADTLMMIQRTYIAVDASGNESEPCTYTFFVERLPDFGEDPDNPAVDFPDHFLMNSGNPLECDADYAKLPNGNPSPVDIDGKPGTGVPTYETIEETYDLYPNPDQFCNLLIDFEDKVILDDGCVTKIMREWSVIEWSCDSQQRTEIGLQMIEIVDSVGPDLTVPADMTVTTNDHKCGATVFIPDVTVDDNCDNEDYVTLSYAGGFDNDFDGGFVELDTGLNILTFIAYDLCGNSSEETMEVVVEDKTPPVVICDEFTVVSLTTDGVAWVHASTFDDGSYDECKLDRMEVRRMDGDGCDEDEDGIFAEADDFDEYVKFCCSDIGTDVMVVLRVWDKAGNHNECMVTVEVQDKLPPQIVCPPDMTIACGFDFADLSVFGSVQTSEDAVEPIVIADDYLLKWEGGVGELEDGYAVDNCVVSVTVDSSFFLNQCNIGYISRTFTARDAGGRTASCTQYITFENPTPFDLELVEWPRDTLIDGCMDPESGMFHPDNLGYPGFDEDECALLGTSYEDQVFPFNNPNGEACFKILRKWKVIDWCQFEEVETHHETNHGSHGSNFEYETVAWTQVIKVNNSIDPVISGDYDRVSVCTYDQTCTDGFIELNASAVDDCTAELKASYQIDAFNDGSFDISSGTQIGNSISASGTYPIGSHRIVWTFEDLCGNKVSQEQLFDIVNCKAPTPYCINGLAVDLMPMDFDEDGDIDGGMVELWASDFDAGSSHPCGYEVILSFSEDIDSTNRVFTCADEGLQTIRIYATVITPMGEEIQDYCSTTVDIQDNMNACEDGVGGRAAVSGLIATEDNKTLEDVAVELKGSELADAMTGSNGQYAFADMPVGGAYKVIPEKNDDPLNGVSTLDLVLIQRHILGIGELNSPYKLIASDINKDGKVSATDLIELRKLILGFNDNYSSNTSWRFVDKLYNFENTETALQETFNEVYDIAALNNNMIVDFVGVKVGDVNANATTNRFDNPTTRSNRSLDLNISDRSFKAGDRISVDVTVGELQDLIGMQATITIDPTIAVIEGIQGQGMDMTASNFNLNDEAMVTISWNNPDGVRFNDGDVAFTLELSANAAGSIAQALNIVNNPLTAEAYDANQEVLSLDLNILSDEGGEFQLLQNTPNPFTDVTQIGFVLPQDMNVTINVFDVTGKSIKVIRNNFNAGKNTVSLSKHELNTTGVVYYTLQAGNYTATKKMVILQ